MELELFQNTSNSSSSSSLLSLPSIPFPSLFTFHNFHTSLLSKPSLFFLLSTDSNSASGDYVVRMLYDNELRIIPACGGTLLPLLFFSSLLFLLHFTSLHFTSLHFTSPHFTSLHFTSLHFTSLHFTSLLFSSLLFSSHFSSPLIAFNPLFN